jgi:DNA repair protein RadA/Sms
MLLAVLTRHASLALTDREVYASTVGGLSAGEPAADLAIALAVASAARDAPLAPTLVAIGEVSLSGDVRRVGRLDRRLAEAARLGFTTALVPAGHAGEALTPAAGAGITAVPVSTMTDALAAVAGMRGRVQAARRPVLRPLRGGA